MRFFLLKKLFRARFKRWSRYAKDLRQLKESCCLRIQVTYRGYRARSLRQSLHKRCVQANRKYLIACELHHSFTLVQLLRTWNGIWLNTRNHRCAHLIIVFLNISSWQVKLKRAGVKLHKLLMIKKKYGNRRSFQRFTSSSFFFHPHSLSSRPPLPPTLPSPSLPLSLLSFPSPSLPSLLPADGILSSKQN